MEVVYRAAVIFVVLWMITRVLGKRELAQLSAFELVLLVSMGDLIQQGVTQEDYSLTGAVLAVGTFAVLSIALAYISWRFPRARPLLNGAPIVIARDGHVLDEILRHERLPIDEVLQAAREQGIRDLSDVELAVLEPRGAISFFTRQGASDGG